LLYEKQLLIRTFRTDALLDLDLAFVFIRVIAYLDHRLLYLLYINMARLPRPLAMPARHARLPCPLAMAPP
jgi:hypothetical protein